MIGFGRQARRPGFQALGQALLGQGLQIGFVGESLGHLVVRKRQGVVCQVHPALFRNATGVQHGFREFGKLCDHLLRGLDVQLVGVELHAVGVAQRFPGLQAQHDFMRARVFFFQVVTIVGSDQWDAEFFVDLHEAPVGDQLIIEPIGLDFEIIMVFPEDLAVLSGGLRGFLHVPLADEIGNLPAQTPG